VRRPARIAAIATAALAGLALFFWLRSGGPYRGATGDASLLLITVDGLRADRVGACGGPAGLTPELDTLAGQGVAFTQAFTASAASLPAHASLMSGRWPFDHGVRDRDADRLPSPVTTLAEALARRGFHTAAIVSSPQLSGLSGLDQGFEIYDDALPGPWRPAPVVTDAAIERLRALAAGRSFLWVHYADPALPLAAPEPFRSGHAGQPYDGIVAYVDSEIGRLLQSLAASGRAGRTLVVVAGAHGQGLGAHGEMLQGSTIYDEVARVPLIVSLPPHVPSGVKATSIARLVDLYPTVLELLRIEPETAGAPAAGTSLWPSMAGRGAGEDTLAYVEAMDGPADGWSAVAGVRDARFAFMLSPRPELYELAVDPGETTNLAGARSDRMSGYRAKLAALRGEGAAAADGSLPDVKDRREALHRVERARMAAAAGQHETAVREAKEGLAQTPGDRRLKMILAASLAALGRTDEAIASWSEVLAAWPGQRAAMAGLGAALERTGRAPEADALYRQGARMDPDDPRWLSGMARAALMRGDAPEAARLFTSALRARPDHLPAIEAMARLLESSGKLEQAAAFHARAVEVQPLRLESLMAWSWVLFRLQRHDEALGILQRARDVAPSSAAVDLATGDVSLAAGKIDEAREAYERVLKGDPRSAQALYGLGFIALKSGGAGAVEMIGKALELRPEQAAWREDYAHALASAGRFGPAADQMDLYLTSGQAPAARRESLRQEAAGWRRRARG
jgi:choline-sulfatase